MSTKVRFGVMLSVALMATIVLALLAEGAVRLRANMKHGTTSLSVAALYHTDEALGLRVLTPGAKLKFDSINKQGFRGPDIVSPKPHGTIRLAFIGASTTFCAEVYELDQTWPHLITQALKQRFPGVRFDYVNAAVSGWQYSRWLRCASESVFTTDRSSQVT